MSHRYISSHEGSPSTHMGGAQFYLNCKFKPPKFKLEMTREGTGRRIMETEVQKKRPGEKRDRGADLSEREVIHPEVCCVVQALGRTPHCRPLPPLLQAPPTPYCRPLPG